MDIDSLTKLILTDEAKLFVFGLGEENFQRLRRNIETSWSRVAGGERVTDADVERHMQELRTNVIPSLVFGTSTFAVNLKLQEAHRFFKLPAIDIASQTVAGMGEFVGEALRTRQEILHEYGMTAKTSAMALILLGVHGASSIRYVRNVVAALRTVRDVRGALSAVKAASAVNPLSLLVSLGAFAISYVGGELAYRAATSILSERASRLAMQQAVVQLLDPERVITDYELYRGTNLAMEGPDIYEALEEMMDRRYYGISPAMFGFDYSNAVRVIHDLNLLGRMTRSNYLNYAARTMQLGAMFGTDMTQTMSSMSRLTLGRDIEEATELFETFFSSLVVDGKVHISQLALVSEMSSLVESYTFGTRINVNTPESMARIHKFVSPMIGHRQSITPTETLVRGVDDVLWSGGIGGNQHVSRIMAQTGISRYEALRGVTYNPETLERFLRGMYLQLGIGRENFNEEGELGHEDMERFMAFTRYGLGMDPVTQRAVFVAYRGYQRGQRMEEVSREYAQEFKKRTTEELPENSMIQLADSWSEGSRQLTEVIFSYADVMISLHEDIMDLTRVSGPRLMYEVQRATERARVRIGEVVGIDRPATVPRITPPTVVDYIETPRDITTDLPTTVSTAMRRVLSLRLGTPSQLPREVSSVLSPQAFDALFRSVIYQESRGLHVTEGGYLVRSHAGALGITQVMPDTGRMPGFGVRPLRDSSKEEYIRFGRDYLIAMIKWFDGNLEMALAAYNWGAGSVEAAVRRHGANWLNFAPLETRNYVRQVMERWRRIKGLQQERGSRIQPLEDSRETANYVNIDLEVNGIDTLNLANYLQTAVA